MSLTFGLQRKDTIRTIWKGDSAVDHIIDEAAYDRTFDPKYLALKPGVAPQWLTVRPLTVAVHSRLEDEARLSSGHVGAATLHDFLFAAGVDFEPCLPTVTADSFVLPSGPVPKRVVQFGNIEMLHPGVLDALKRNADGSPDHSGALMVASLGALVRRGCVPEPSDPLAPSPTSGEALGASASGSPQTAAPGAPSAPSKPADSSTAPTSG